MPTAMPEVPTRTAVMPDLDAIDLGLLWDLDRELDDNDRGHFRSTHRDCAIALASGGVLLEGNCGHLFRTRGRVSFTTENRPGRCGDCVRERSRLPCPVCGEGVEH